MTWILRQIFLSQARRRLQDLAELERLVKETNEKHACMEMRKRFAAYSKGIQNGAALRAQIVHASTVQEYEDIFSSLIK